MFANCELSDGTQEERFSDPVDSDREDPLEELLG